MYRAIVVGTDCSSRARAAVQHAASLAKATGAALHIVSAYKVPSLATSAAPEAGLMVATSDTDAEASVQGVLDDLASTLRRDGLEVSTYACPIPPADALCDVAAAQHADVIVVGDKGVHGPRRLLGSVPTSITRRATCAVLIVPTGD
jgi:nucleotide-binding universal stress UspA family protein